MKLGVVDFVRRVLRRFGVEVIPAGYLATMTSDPRLSRGSNWDFQFLRAFCSEELPILLELIEDSKSQLRQDLFVLSQLGFKKNGYFVEFGATDGMRLSNTWLLEKKFGWTGILAEPCKNWHKDLQKNRTCHISTECVWSVSGATLQFVETSLAELSTVAAFQDCDGHAHSRGAKKNYEVQTISLVDLLAFFNAPKMIDYLSIDTEGSEFSILQSHDFNRYRFRLITCEHNSSPARTQIFDLLTKNGYRRVLESVSRFDDWYVLNEVSE